MLIFFNFWVYFQRVFVFPIFFKLLSDVLGLTKQNDCQPIFLIWCSNLALLCVSMATFQLAFVTDQSETRKFVEYIIMTLATPTLQMHKILESPDI